MRGTIRKLKNRKTKTWEVRVDVPSGANGVRRMKSVSVRGTKRDADMKLRTLLSSLDKGLSPESSKTTTSQYLDWWLQTYPALNVRPRTSERYGSDIRLHISPVIGSTLEIEPYYDDLDGLLTYQPWDSEESYVQYLQAVKRGEIPGDLGPGAFKDDEEEESFRMAQKKSNLPEVPPMWIWRFERLDARLKLERTK